MKAYDASRKFSMENTKFVLTKVERSAIAKVNKISLGDKLYALKAKRSRQRQDVEVVTLITTWL